MIETKVCSKCKQELPLSKFYKRKDRKCGVISHCKLCSSQYYLNNKAVCIERNKMWKRNNPQKIKQMKEKWNIENADKISKYRKKSYRKNPKKSWVKNTIRYHKRRGILVNITIESLLKIIMDLKYCEICGIELNWDVGNKIYFKTNSPTIDRKNNDKYIDKNNMLIVCHQCNVSKGKRKWKEFIEYCKIIYEKFGDELKDEGIFTN